MHFTDFLQLVWIFYTNILKNHRWYDFYLHWVTKKNEITWCHLFMKNLLQANNTINNIYKLLNNIRFCGFHGLLVNSLDSFAVALHPTVSCKMSKYLKLHSAYKVNLDLFYFQNYFFLSFVKLHTSKNVETNHKKRFKIAFCHLLWINLQLLYFKRAFTGFLLFSSSLQPD